MEKQWSMKDVWLLDENGNKLGKLNPIDPGEIKNYVNLEDIRGGEGKMKEYIRLSVDVTAYWSGSSYCEKVFLPKEVWEEIKDDIDMYMYIYELDGKHSEVKADIEVTKFNEQQLATYQPFQDDDGENLFYHIYEYLDEDKYDNKYLGKIQDEVEAYCQVDTMTIKFNKQNKEKIMELIKDYII